MSVVSICIVHCVCIVINSCLIVFVQSGISKPLPIVVVRDPTDHNTMSLHQKAMKVVVQYREEARHHKQLRDERFLKAKEALQKGRTAVASYYLQMVSEVMKGLINLNRLTFMTGIQGLCCPSRNHQYHTIYLILSVVT
jgi:Domain of unknown function (DUF1771).